MRTVSVAHLKGGVGKTTVAVNLAHLASAAGIKTLIVDLDGQAAATYLLRADPSKAAKPHAVAEAKKSLRDRIVATDFPGLDLLPSSLSYRKLPTMLAATGSGKPDKDRIGRALRRVGKPYDLVVVDAPAGLTLESEEILRASDLVLVPVIPSPLALRSFEDVGRFAAGRYRGPIRGVLSMVDRRRKLHRELCERVARDPGDFWPVEIPYAAAVERMTAERLPIGALSRPGRALAAFNELFREVEAALELRSAPVPGE